MKDAYSFDADGAGAETSYQKMYRAYCSIFERCGLTFRAVEADTGPIGGSSSHEFMVLADTGEDSIFSCDSCGYAASRDKAEVGRREGEPGGALPEGELRKVATPSQRTVEEVTSFLKVRPEQLIKTMIFQQADTVIAALTRGDHEINEVKLANLLGAETICLADDQTIERATHAPKGFAGPVGLTLKLLADNALRSGTNYVTGGNEKDVHLVNVNPGRDFQIERFADLRYALDGDPCPRCTQGRMVMSRGIEVGHIFRLGTKYSAALGATFLDAAGKPHPLVMGCYGIGVGRTIAAAIEQNNDENGIIFPLSIAPFQVIVTSVKPHDPQIRETSERIYRALLDAGVDVTLDDRDERPGIKFKDADLIGVPLRVTIGTKAKEGMVDIKLRKSQATIAVRETDLTATVKDLLSRDQTE
jgi:prolyl-tRNA synthetase